MNRPRKEGESFKQYRKNLKKEAAALKKKLKPRVIWTSKMVIEDPKDPNPPGLRRLLKINVRGAFNRALGHRMPSSLSEKRREERAQEKMRKQNEKDLSRESV